MVVVAEANGMAGKGARPLGSHRSSLYLPSLLCHLVGETKTSELRRPVEASPGMHVVGAQQNASGRNTARQLGGLNLCGSAGKLWCQCALWEAREAGVTHRGSVSQALL